MMRITKTESTREFFQTIAEFGSSPAPYVMFEDTVNRANPIAGKVIMLQPVLRDPAGF